MFVEKRCNRHPKHTNQKGVSNFDREKLQGGKPVFRRLLIPVSLEKEKITKRFCEPGRAEPSQTGPGQNFLEVAYLPGARWCGWMKEGEEGIISFLSGSGDGIFFSSHLPPFLPPSPPLPPPTPLPPASPSTLPPLPPPPRVYPQLIRSLRSRSEGLAAAPPLPH